jgi:hypothetical protein
MRRFLLHLGVAVVLTVVGSAGFAATIFIGPTSGDLDDPANWDNGLPSSSNLGTIGSGKRQGLLGASPMPGTTLTCKPAARWIVPVLAQAFSAAASLPSTAAGSVRSVVWTRPAGRSSHSIPACGI